jgi:glycosyltransferase involved in cell wall biosynthesis
MRILLVSHHRYPAAEETGQGLHPKEYPSGSGYHLHDLLAQGLAEAGHEVFYLLKKGSEVALPTGVKLVVEFIPDIDLCHSLAVPILADESLEFSRSHRKPCLLTCHMDPRGRETSSSLQVQPNWVFVSRTLARSQGSERFVLNGLAPANYIFSESKEDYFLFMCSMDKAAEKGLEEAISLSKRKGFCLIVAGTARDYQTIDRVRECCARSGAEYAGDVRGEKKATILAGARAVLFPSRLNEGCPLVLLEALMSGTPVVSSSCGGSVEIVSPDVGFLCASTAEWDQAIDHITEISPARCREVALEKYHYRRMVKDYLREYQVEMENYGG